MDNENMYKPRRKSKRKKVKSRDEVIRSIRIELRKRLPSVLNQVHNQRSWELACQ